MPIVAFGAGRVAQEKEKHKATDLKLQTEDQVTIAATLRVPNRDDSEESGEASGKFPAVILIHQGGSNRSEWDPVAKRLANQKIVTLAYDVRGHGKSDKVKSIMQLFNDPELAPKDLKAAIAYLKEHDSVDPKRIGVVGASIGSNLACVASSEMGIKTAVAISGKTSAVQNLAGKDQLNMKSVMHVSSDGDQNGMRAKWAKELFDKTAEPRKLDIVKGSRGHGVSIFKDDAQLVDRIVKWLNKTL